jgi:hypothetical protein
MAGYRGLPMPRTTKAPCQMPLHSTCLSDSPR